MKEAIDAIIWLLENEFGPVGPEELAEELARIDAVESIEAYIVTILNDKEAQGSRKMYLIYDGTMDTVFVCENCGKEIRYCFEAVERDGDGMVTLSAFEQAEEEHSEECEEAE